MHCTTQAPYVSTWRSLVTFQAVVVPRTHCPLLGVGFGGWPGCGRRRTPGPGRCLHLSGPETPAVPSDCGTERRALKRAPSPPEGPRPPASCPRPARRLPGLAPWSSSAPPTGPRPLQQTCTPGPCPGLRSDLHGQGFLTATLTLGPPCPHVSFILSPLSIL